VALFFIQSSLCSTGVELREPGKRGSLDFKS